MKIEIDGLTEEELIELNQRIVARLRFLAQKRAHAHMLEFSIGDRVAFQPEGRPVPKGLFRASISVLRPDVGMISALPAR